MELSGLAARTYFVEKNSEEYDQVNAKERIQIPGVKSIAAREISDDDPIGRRIISFFKRLVSEEITIKDITGVDRTYLVNTNSLIHNLNLNEKGFKKASDEGKVSIIAGAVLGLLRNKGFEVREGDDVFLFIPAVTGVVEEQKVRGQGDYYKIENNKRPILVAEGNFDDNGKLVSGFILENEEGLIDQSALFEKEFVKKITNNHPNDTVWYRGAIKDNKPYDLGFIMAGDEEVVRIRIDANGTPNRFANDNI